MKKHPFRILRGYGAACCATICAFVCGFAASVTAQESADAGTGSATAAREEKPRPEPTDAERDIQAGRTPENRLSTSPIYDEPWMKPAATSGAERPAVNDPTIPTEDLRRALSSMNPVPVSLAPVPELRLRARVIVEGRPASALIEVNGETIAVQEGSRLSVAPSGRTTTRTVRTPARSVRSRTTTQTTGTTAYVRPPTLELEITQLDENEITIDISPIDETIIIR